MRYAVCLYGLLGGTVAKDGVGNVIHPSHAGVSVVNLVVDPNRADVFAHTWTVGFDQEIRDVYEPIALQSEDRRDVPNEELFRGLPFLSLRLKLESLGAWKLGRISQRWGPSGFEDLTRAASRWESTRRSLRLVFQHEREMGFRYDAVFLTRYDVAFYSPFDFSPLDSNWAYLSNWNHAPKEGQPIVYENLNVGRSCLDLWAYLPRYGLEKFYNFLGDFRRFDTDPHVALYQYIRAAGYPIDYTKYRWVDFELVRRKEMGANL